MRRSLLGPLGPRRWGLALGLTLLVVGACVPAARTPARGAAASSVATWRAQADATVIGVRLIPEVLDPSIFFGTDPGGAARYLAGGERIKRSAAGAVTVADDRFSSTPRAWALPARFGGGFLFVVDRRTIYRADAWLSEPRPLLTSSRDTIDVWPGLDRVYLKEQTGTVLAIDPRRPASVDLGPWPRAPVVTAYRALDGWRAVAIADLRGVVATSDAGASWRTIALPVDAQGVGVARVDPVTGDSFELSPDGGASGDFLFVRGTGSRRCFVVGDAAVATELSACPERETVVDPSTRIDQDAAKIFGGRPLLRAVEDGWPIEGTVLLAKDGALGRLRLADGAWLDVRREAFASKTARCHPMRLLVDGSAPGLGFACAEAGGRVIIYRADPIAMTMAPLKTFDDPRPVLSFDNGAVAVRGPCDAPARPLDGGYCTFARHKLGGRDSPSWTEIRTPPNTEDNARLLLGNDGEAAFLVPPNGRLDDAHLARVRDGAVEIRPLSFPPLSAEVVRALETGVWLDGFEEREPRVFGGWVDAAGAMLGVEVDGNGRVKVGAYVRDAGSPIVSGRYGFGWSPSRRGYQTIDGGMTWTTVTGLPDPRPVVRERACGPIGCTAAGWIRLGWDGSPDEGRRRAPLGVLAAAPTEPRSSERRRDYDLDLICESTGPRAAPRPAELIQNVGDDPVVRAEASASVDHGARLGTLARMAAWGPRSEDWSHVGKWAIDWAWPYGGPGDVRSTSVTVAPFATLDAARRALLGTGPVNLHWSVAVGDDANTALLIGRPFGSVPWVQGVLALEADRPPVEIRRADGLPFSEVDFAMRASRRWYLVSQQSADEPRAAVVYRVDGAEAHEVARVPRTMSDARPRLARNAAGRTIGVVVDGPASTTPTRWVVPLDVETGSLSEPEPLGAADMRDRADLPVCTEGADGWVLDTTWNGQAYSARARVQIGAPGGARDARDAPALVLRHLYVRVRLAGTQRACVEQVSGTYDGDADGTAVLAPPAGTPRSHVGGVGVGARRPGPAVPVSVLRGRERDAFRCVPR